MLILRSGTPVQSPRPRNRSRSETLAVSAVFAALTVALTWPHATVLTTHAADHQDVYFNLWRLRWIAHALVSQPSSLFGGNIFYPEPNALTFSDAMLVEGVLAAPLFWLGLPPLLIHNLTLWAAFVGSGAGMFVLARELTGSRAGAFASAIIFTFAPYRFDHYMHMELQWAVWVPWAFWALHRTIDSGSWRYGLLTGLFMSLQMLSAIYYGIFLATLLPLVGLVLLSTAGPRQCVRALRALAGGAVSAAVVCGAYSLPYLETRQQVGGRGDSEIATFSARPSSYLIATPDNAVWGRTLAGRSRPERRLFPGALALLLAYFGLMLRAPGVTRLAYLVGAIAAFELSLGLSGYSYRFLYDHVPIYNGLRAIARAGLFVLFFVAVLAGFGYASLARGLRPGARRALFAGGVLLLLAEYRVRPPALVPYPNEAPPLYAWLAGQPPGVVAELPMAVPEALPGPDPRYAYLSTFHWKPLLNGYSGYHPRSYIERADDLRGFPDDRSIARLRQDGAFYVVVHFDAYNHEEQPLIREALVTRHRMVELEHFPGVPVGSAVFALK